MFGGLFLKQDEFPLFGGNSITGVQVVKFLKFSLIFMTCVGCIAYAGVVKSHYFLIFGRLYVLVFKNEFPLKGGNSSLEFTPKRGNSF